MLRILHLEDDKNDAELVLAALSEEGIEFNAKIVDSREDFISALERDTFDVVLADYSLPSFDGLSALEIVRKKSPDLPFIFVSGAMGEDLAVETLKKGGTDVVLKNRLSRLAPSVNRALRESNEIKKRKEAEEARRSSDARYRNLFETVRDIVYTLSEDGTITSINPTFDTITGYSREEWIGKHFAPLIHPEDLSFSMELHRRAVAGEQLPIFELRLSTKQGEYRDMEFSVSHENIGGEFIIIGIARDITEHKKLEALIGRAERMDALGQLAGGIAHDFNNVLTIIMGNANSLQIKVDNDSPLQMEINNISKAVKKGADLIRSLLVLGKKGEINLKAVNVNEVVKSAEKLFGKFLGKGVELKIDLAYESLMVMADAGSLENVLINLAINAKDAMPEGGVLSVKTSRDGLVSQSLKAFVHGRPGKYAIISISDTGSGMDEKTKKRIFEPFFTTKEADKGTGLGLSMAYGTIKQHNGYIDVQSELGMGTIFNIYLPLIE